MFKNMTVKKKKAIVVFELVSVSLIVAILGFYAIRLYHSYKDMQKRMQDAADLVELHLYQVLEAGADKSLSDNGLIFIPGTQKPTDEYDADSGDYYYWSGRVNNNYVLYSGQLYRMLDINSNGEIRAISENVITESVMENKTFAETSLFQFLNRTQTEHSGIFFDTLEFSARLVANGKYAVATLNQNGQAASKDKNEFTANVGLLSLDDYIMFGGSKSYINNGTTFWILDETASHAHFWIDAKGNISCCESPIMLSGVRPVITFSYDTYAASGTGTQADPYVIRSGSEEKEEHSVSDLSVGRYVSYADLVWRVSEKDENGNAVLLLTSVVTDAQGEPVQKKYTDFQKYLNADFVKVLPSYQDVLLKKDWPVGRYNDFQTQDFSYLYTYQKTENAYVAIADLSGLYMNGFRDCFLSTGFETSADLIAFINEEGTIVSDFKTGSDAKAHAAVPMICLKGEIKVLSGTGSSEDPIILNLNEEAAQ